MSSIIVLLETLLGSHITALQLLESFLKTVAFKLSFPNCEMINSFTPDSVKPKID